MWTGAAPFSPTTQFNRTAQTLRSIVDTKSRGVFGTTPAGTNWVIKALHPSDPMTDCEGIPDQSAVPSLFMNYQATFTLQTAREDDQPWSFDMALVPNPISFLWTRNFYENDLEECYLHMNPQIPGTTFAEKYGAFKALAERWRLAYMSVTVYQDAPALADQGTIVAAQVPVTPTIVTGGEFHEFNTGVASSVMFATPKFHHFKQNDIPNYERSQAMPNSYFARSKEGCYLPLKLTNTCQEWRSDSDSFLGTNGYDANYPAVHDLGSWVTRSGAIGVPKGTDGTEPADSKTWFPYGGENGAREACYHYFSASAPYIATTIVKGDACPALCNGNIGHISVRNVASTTSFSFFVRAGFEMQVNPTSTLSPQLRLSPMHDRAALDAYFAIARELKDAYPADYNDLGKIWNMIKAAANMVAPVLKFTPIGPLVSAAEGPLRALSGVVDRAAAGKRERKLKTTPRDKPSLAEKQREEDREMFQSLLARYGKTVSSRKAPKVKGKGRKKKGGRG